MISNATSTVEKMRKDLRKIADDVSLICFLPLCFLFSKLLVTFLKIASQTGFSQNSSMKPDSISIKYQGSSLESRLF